MSRAALGSVQEALEIGDVDYANAILTSALADDQRARRYACPECPNLYRWPGERDRHRVLIHGITDEDD